MAEYSVKVILTDDEGQVREINGEAIVFAVSGGDSAVAGVFGGYSVMRLRQAREFVLEAIEGCPTGKRMAEMDAMMSVRGALQ